MKRFLRLFLASFVILVIIAGILPSGVFAQGLPSFIKKVGNALVPVSSNYTFGDASNRWDGWFDDLDATTLTFGGFAPGDVTVNGQLFVNDDDGIAVQTSGTDRMYFRNTDSGFTNDDQVLVARASGTGSGLWGEAGHLVFQARSNDSAERDIIFLDGDGTETARFTSDSTLTFNDVGIARGAAGQLNISDPSNSAGGALHILDSAGNPDIKIYEDAGGAAAIDGAGALYFLTGGVGRGWFDVSNGFLPWANNTQMLGSASFAWGDLFLGDGAVVNFNNGDVTLTHSSGALSLGGGTLNPSSADTIDLGGTGAEWRSIYLGDSDGVYLGLDQDVLITNSGVEGGLNIGSGQAVPSQGGILRILNSNNSAQMVLNGDTGDITAYNPVNDGNPELKLGASGSEELHVQTVFDTGAQTLDHVLFQTDVASATDDKGLYRFNVDGSDVLDIDDGGIDLDASNGLSISGTDIITDSAGTATLSNIDALDATTTSTISAAVGGGGGASIYDASVCSSGCDYTDIQAAITGVGGTDISLLLDGDITEDSNIAVPSGADLYIHIQDHTLTLGNNDFTYTAAADVFVEGNGVESGAEIDWTETTNTVFMFDNGAYSGSTVTLKGLTWDNNSSGSNTRLSGEDEYVYDVRAELNNVAGGSFAAATTSVYENVDIVGAGTSTSSAFQVFGTGPHYIRNLRFSGTFSTSTSTISISSDDTIIDGLYFDHSTSGTGVRFVNANCQVSNVVNRSAQTLEFLVDIGSYGNFTNIDLGSGQFDLRSDHNNITNLRTTGELAIASQATQNRLTNVSADSALTVSGDHNQISNGRFIGGVTFPSGADNNSMSFSQVGADAGSGSNTITVDSGSNNTILMGNHVDAAISDSGTGTVNTGNVTY